jgi:hypothetical protein
MVQVANKVGTAVLQAPAAFEGKVFTFNFTVKADAKFGECKINADASIGNGTGNDITAEGTSVKVVCKDHAWTDKVAADYLKSEATCTAKAVYFKSCSVCGEKGTETFETGDMLAHTYAQKAEAKYQKTEATCLKQATYVESCSVCGGEGTVTFAAGELAAHTFETWTKVDANNHKSACAVAGCTEETTKAHEFAAELTAGEKTHWNECVCGEKKNETDHVFDEKKWEKDETNHWDACACGAKSGEAKHAWDEGKVTKEPTTKAEGEKTFTCKDCAGVKVEKLDKLASPKTGDESFLLIVTMLVAMSACGVAAVLVLKKRQAR